MCGRRKAPLLERSERASGDRVRARASERFAHQSAVISARTNASVPRVTAPSLASNARRRIETMSAKLPPICNKAPLRERRVKALALRSIGGL